MPKPSYQNCCTKTLSEVDLTETRGCVETSLSFMNSFMYIRSQLKGMKTKLTAQNIKSLDILTAYRVLFLRPPEYRGARKLETEDFSPAGLFVRVPSPGINSPDRRGAAAHKDAQCLSLSVLCQNLPPEKCLPWPERVRKRLSIGSECFFFFLPEITNYKCNICSCLFLFSTFSSYCPVRNQGC